MPLKPPILPQVGMGDAITAITLVREPKNGLNMVIPKKSLRLSWNLIDSNGS
jgi:hypothetical protein